MRPFVCLKRISKWDSQHDNNIQQDELVFVLPEDDLKVEVETCQIKNCANKQILVR
jgi:hypothetical protein